jgi:hypothetical protein
MAHQHEGPSLTRRATLRGLGGGMAGALLASAAAEGLRRAEAADGRDDDRNRTQHGPDKPKDGQGTTHCMTTFEATIRQGPRAGTTFRGVLDLTVDPVGRINEASISLQMDLGPGGTIYGVGVARADVRLCAGRMGGPFVGPLEGEAGDWVGGTGASLNLAGRGLFFSDPDQHVIYRKATLASAAEVFAGAVGVPGYVDNIGRRNARFNRPGALGADPAETALYVADYTNQAIRRIDFTTNQATTVVGLPQARTVVPGLAFWGVEGVDTTSTGLVAISDSFNHVIWRYNQSNLNLRVLAGAVGQPGLQDGVGAAARFRQPGSLLYRSNDQSFSVADVGNNAVRIVTSDNAVSTIALSP